MNTFKVQQMYLLNSGLNCLIVLESITPVRYQLNGQRGLALHCTRVRGHTVTERITVGLLN